MDVTAAINELHSQGFFIWDDFLSPLEVEKTVQDYLSIYGLNFFKPAGTGNQSDLTASDGRVRSDETYWLDSLNLTATQSVFWNRLEKLKEEINRQLFLGLWSLDGHYSRYPRNGFYHRHLDRFNSNDQRTISMVLYFNEKWISEDGGALRLHSAPLGIVDVNPIAGRLVCFLSSTMLHEVMVTNQVRLSFAGWWKRRN